MKFTRREDLHILIYISKLNEENNEVNNIENLSKKLKKWKLTVVEYFDQLSGAFFTRFQPFWLILNLFHNKKRLKMNKKHIFNSNIQSQKRQA